MKTRKPPLPRGFKVQRSSIDAHGGNVLLVNMDEYHDSFYLRTSRDRHGVSVKLDGEQMDHLIRELIAARGGEWLDLLEGHNGG
jgi:hypothetical protein